MRSWTLALISVLFLSCSGEQSGERDISTNRAEASTDTKETNQIGELDTSEAPKEPANAAQPVPEIQFERELSFGSTDEVVVGAIETVTVDDSDRVFIADRDQVTIQVFNSDGTTLPQSGVKARAPVSLQPYPGIRP